MTAFVFLGAFRYAAAHVFSAVAPLQPALVEPVAASGASVSPTPRAAGLALPFISVPSDIPASTRAPTTRTRQS